jgi:acyl-CoA reductase-like NAD-dependent aldehyde dehydrogenase
MGPVATAGQLAKVESFVSEAVDVGAELVAGGRRQQVVGLPDGFFYRPTILADVDRTSHLTQEEIFGPVLAVFPFETEDEALEIANGTAYGLAGGVWSRDIGRAHSVARRLQAGTVWLNMDRAMAPQSPFRGFKSSGIGRINGLEGLDAYLQTKSIWCELSNEIQDPFVLEA